MFAFNLWSRFGAFRDPITVTQNVTLSIPPKTTIGGMLAAILGMDYNDYFENPNYFDFKYSLVLKNPIWKQSFSQNYVNDYTKESSNKHKVFINLLKKSKLLENYKKHISVSMQSSFQGDEDVEESFDNEKLTKKKADYQKALEDFSQKLCHKMPKPKPIRRELLLNPSYLIFIKDFIFKDEIIQRLQSHDTGFALYMGNSEFSANYEFLKCDEFIEQKLSQIKSFTQFSENIKFEAGRKYTSVYAATKTVEGRKYRDYKKITICDKVISFNTPVDGAIVKTAEGAYNCEFI